jgi:hypothetical protein
MRKIFLFMIVCIAPIVASAQNDVIVDPNAEVRALNASFTGIKVSGGIDLYLSQSDNEAIAVSASEEKFIKKLRTVVENGVLKISMEEEGFLHITTKDRKLKAYVSFRDINKLDVSGAASIHVSGSITVNTLHLSCSGASSFKGNVKVNDLEMDLSGASDMKISGTARNVNIQSSGASDVKGIELSTDICTAKASGASDIEITVNKELNANASGASSIIYKGEGGIRDMHSSGSSSISRKS